LTGIHQKTPISFRSAPIFDAGKISTLLLATERKISPILISDLPVE
jgi:hypothetical protein